MRLSDCFIDVIAYVAYFRKAKPTRQPSYDHVRAEILRRMSNSERAARDQFGDEAYDSARFAIAAWIDETILKSDWPDRDKWQKEPLLRQYDDGKILAGEQFFDRLAAIAGRHQRDLMEVYYLCLAMGFQGQYYHVKDQPVLDGVKTNLMRQLTGSSLGVTALGKDQLFPEAFPRSIEGPGNSPKGGYRSLLIFLVFPAGFLALYAIYAIILKIVGENLIRGIL